MQMKFTMYNDPGHAWLRVTPAEVFSLGLTVQDFTPYSYRSKDNKYWYLEEDLDAFTFIRAYEAKMGHPLTYKNSFTEGQSAIRRKVPLLNYRVWDRDAFYERRAVAA